MSQAYVDLSAAQLIEMAVQRGEGILGANGALRTLTGARTGRSPKDRFIVKEPATENDIDWGSVNQPFEEEKFTALWQKVEQYLLQRDHFIANLHVAADAKYTLPVKVVSQYAWHNLFCKQLFIRSKLATTHSQWTILCAPEFKTEPERDGTLSDVVVVLHLSKRQILICGTAFAGEMKKAMFAVLNYLLPKYQVLPMHCAANVGKDGDVALFFGLSGTGKTTLSADPERYLIGDDEHGWSLDGVFNFEGGCYAKCIDLRQEKEPVIYDALRFGAIMENVVLDEHTREPIYTDSRYTQNTRAAYPLEHIPLRVEKNAAGQPNAVIFLTCDLYGVLPPVARLTSAQAAYYFLSGYTALVGSTEMGQSPGVKSTFSTCFGAPFFPRPAQVYADLLMQRVEQSRAQVYLVNTGWTGGAYGQGGQRFSIPTTRAVIKAILSGALDRVKFEEIPGFKLAVPIECPGVDAHLLNPVNTWADKQAHAAQSDELIMKFVENFKKFKVSEQILAAGPEIANKAIS
jgi:phosphoenolpyruvate carboxykinase (ATP)